MTFIHPSANANAEWRWEMAGSSVPSQRDMKGSVWEPGGRAHTSRPCGPDSHPLITARPASLSWDTPWTLHRTDGGLLNMQQSRAFPLLTTAARVDNVIPVAPEASNQAKNGYHHLAEKKFGFISRIRFLLSCWCWAINVSGRGALCVVTKCFQVVAFNCGWLIWEMGTY